MHALTTATATTTSSLPSPPLTLHSQLKNKNTSNQTPTLTFHRNHRRLSFPVFFSQKRQDQTSVDEVEDTDKVYGELLQKYGKVVYKRGDAKPVSEADDDAESLSFAVAMAKIADDVKGGDIRVLFVKPLIYWAKFFIITTAFSNPQIAAIGSKMREKAEKQFQRAATGDRKPNSWTLLDFGDVVVHIFLPADRAFYNLEEFYGNAPLIEVPFDNRPPLRN